MERHLFKGFVALVGLAAALFASAGSEQHLAKAQGQERGASTNAPLVAGTNMHSAEAWKLMEEYFATLRKDDVARANDLVPQIMLKGTNDWEALNFLSWRIFADRHIRHRDHTLALAAAQRALQLKGDKDANVLDTYARALFENGKHAQAIEIERKAVQLCTAEAQRIEMEANLNRYVRLSKQAQP
jgi:tetratricopeptide (TPR) repeat protein